MKTDMRFAAIAIGAVVAIANVAIGWSYLQAPEIVRTCLRSPQSGEGLGERSQAFEREIRHLLEGEQSMATAHAKLVAAGFSDRCEIFSCTAQARQYLYKVPLPLLILIRPDEWAIALTQEESNTAVKVRAQALWSSNL